MLTLKMLEELRLAVEQERLRKEEVTAGVGQDQVAAPADPDKLRLAYDSIFGSEDARKLNLARKYGFESWFELSKAVVSDCEIQLALNQDLSVFQKALNLVLDEFGVNCSSIRPFPPPTLFAEYRSYNQRLINEILYHVNDLRLLQRHFGSAETEDNSHRGPLRGPPILNATPPEKSDHVRVVVDKDGSVFLEIDEARLAGDKE